MSENSLSCSSSSATGPSGAASVTEERVKEIERDDTTSYSSSDEEEFVDSSKEPYFDERMADALNNIKEADELMQKFVKLNSPEKVDMCIADIYQNGKPPQEAIFLNVRRCMLKVVADIVQRCYRGGHIIMPYYAFKLHPIRFEAWDLFVSDTTKMSVEFDLRIHQQVGSNRFIGRCDEATAKHIFTLDMAMHASRGVPPSKDEVKFFKPTLADIRSYIATHLVQDNHFRALALKTAQFEEERMRRRDAAKQKREEAAYRAAERDVAASVAAFTPPVVPDEVKLKSGAEMLAIRMKVERAAARDAAAEHLAKPSTVPSSPPPPLLPEDDQNDPALPLISTVDTDADAVVATVEAPAAPAPAAPSPAEPSEGAK
jgi:hypothetical protein